MRRKLKHILSSVTRRTCEAGLRRRLEARWSGIGSILLMHRVVENKSESAAHNLSITTAFLDQALSFLRKADVDLLTLPELCGRVTQEGRSARRAVALTFDDGYRDNLTLALPILRKHQAPVTIFVPSGAPDRAMDVWFLRLERAVNACESIPLDPLGLNGAIPTRTAADKAAAYQRLAEFVHRDLQRNRVVADALMPKRLISDEALLEGYFASWHELRQAAADPLVTIGAHTVSHPVLGDLPEREAHREIVEGRRRLSAELDRDISLFSYPYGGRSECGAREFQLAAQAGFDLAVTTRYGSLYPRHAKRRFALPRVTLGGLREDLGSLAFDVLGSAEPARGTPRAVHSNSLPELRCL